MTEPIFGEGYAGDRSKPAGLRFYGAFGPGGELQSLVDTPDAYVDRETVHFDRTNENGASVTLSFDLVCPNGFYDDVPANRYIAVDDPDSLNALDGATGYFAGYTMQPTPGTLPGEERVIKMRCTDYGLLFRKPSHQVSTKWPPGDGTPVVNTTVEASLTAGLGVTVHPESLRNLYVGKKVFAQNSDGSSRERIEVLTIDYVAGTFTADFTTNKLSTETNVPLALHATGSQVITPASMTNLNVGSLIYCKKNHGVQTIGNEWTVVTAVTGSTFTASFLSWKTHDWTVQSHWQLVGGISDRELIADGFKMHLDTLDGAGAVVTTLVDIESLLDLCFNNEGFYMGKGGVDEINLSLPHGQWEGVDPATILNWVAEQNRDQTKKPQWYPSFEQTPSTGLVTYAPMLRYYDALATAYVAAVALTNHATDFDIDTDARYTEYTYGEDGQAFANVLTVIGANASLGQWRDEDSISNSLANNYIGWVMEAPVVKDDTLTTNAECTARAVELAAAQQLSTRRKAPTVTTYAQVDPYILYNPQAINFRAIYETEPAQDLVVKGVALDFQKEGLAKYTFSLGDPVPTVPMGRSRVPRTIHKGRVSLNAEGRVISVGPSTTRYVSEHELVSTDVDLHIVDTSDGAVVMQLPQAHLHPGLPITVKVVGGATPATIRAHRFGDVMDSIDGEDSIDLLPNQSITLQSAGEYDPEGHGANWHATGSVGNIGSVLVENPMTSVGDMIRGATAGAPFRVPVDTAGKILQLVSTFGGVIPQWMQPVSGNYYDTITLTAATTTYYPAVGLAGTVLFLRIVQDGTGSRLLAYGVPIYFPGGVAPTLSTAPGSIDLAEFVSDGTNLYLVEFELNYLLVEPPPILSDDILLLVSDAVVTDPVSDWQDGSVENNDASQATSGLQPSLTGTLNGHPTVYFDGTDDAMTTPLTIDGSLAGGSTGINVTIVFKPNTGGSGDRPFLKGSTNGWFIGVADNAGNEHIAFACTDHRIYGPVISSWTVVQFRQSADYGDTLYVDGSFAGVGPGTAFWPGDISLAAFGGYAAYVRITYQSVDFAAEYTALAATYGL